MLTVKDTKYLGEIIGQIILDVTAPLKERIKELESREYEVDRSVIEDIVDDRLTPIHQTLDVMPEAILAKTPVPKDGKSATDDQVLRGIAAYLKEHPVKDGKSVTVEDIRPLIDATLSKAILEFERRGTDVIYAAIDKFDVPKDGKDGADGRDGKDADTSAVADRVISQLDLKGQKQDVRKMCQELVADAASKIPVPKDGKDADPVSDDALFAMVRRYLTENPVKNGKNGIDGIDGKDGLPGKDGSDGIDGKDGSDGSDGADGSDGTSVTLADIEPMLKSMNAEWALDFEKRAQQILEKAYDRMPKPRDGISFDDCKMYMEDDGRTLVCAMSNGDKMFEHKFILDHILYREVWSNEADYMKGDAVTYGGSLWIAVKPNSSSRPGASNKSWRLAVKKGRDK